LHRFILRYRPWFLAAAALISIVLAVWFGPTVWRLAQDREALQVFITRLGWFGPIALIFGNALQIVIAPIPGYVFQLAAGFLYGPLWGGIWGSIGLMLGASIAMWLSRTYGRPLVERLVGAERIAKWEQVTRSTNIAVWFVLLLGPTGDLPYFLAGLARVSYFKIMAITAILRIPSIFVVAGAGAGVMYLSWWQLAVIIGVLTAFVIVFMRYQDQILARLDRITHRQVAAKLSREKELTEDNV
jgi:uncharacterized membrane protein YdjX (TVP38/TMEM64 family)